MSVIICFHRCLHLFFCALTKKKEHKLDVKAAVRVCEFLQLVLSGKPPSYICLSLYFVLSPSNPTTSLHIIRGLTFNLSPIQSFALCVLMLFSVAVAIWTSTLFLYLQKRAQDRLCTSTSLSFSLCMLFFFTVVDSWTFLSCFYLLYTPTSSLYCCTSF